MQTKWLEASLYKTQFGTIWQLKNNYQSHSTSNWNKYANTWMWLADAVSCICAFAHQIFFNKKQKTIHTDPNTNQRKVRHI